MDIPKYLDLVEHEQYISFILTILSEISLVKLPTAIYDLL